MINYVGYKLSPGRSFFPLFLSLRQHAQLYSFIYLHLFISFLSICNHSLILLILGVEYTHPTTLTHTHKLERFPHTVCLKSSTTVRPTLSLSLSLSLSLCPKFGSQRRESFSRNVGFPVAHSCSYKGNKRF